MDNITPHPAEKLLPPVQDVPGVYQITNTADGKSYVGSSIYLRKRLRAHINLLLGQRHDNRWLQRAWNKHGPDSFAFSILETISNPDDVIEREQFYIDTLKPRYNLSPTAGSTRGVVPSAETRDLTARIMREKWADPGFRSRMLSTSALSKGHNPTPEILRRRGQSLKNAWARRKERGLEKRNGHVPSAENLAKLQAARRKVDERKRADWSWQDGLFSGRVCPRCGLWTPLKKLHKYNSPRKSFVCTPCVVKRNVETLRLRTAGKNP